MFVDLRSAIGRGLFMKGEFDPLVFQPLRDVLKKGGTFLDVGANVGFYSMLGLDAVGSSGNVHAFEIDPRPLRCLRRTVTEGGHANFHIHEIAVSDREGTARLVARSESGNSSVEEVGTGSVVRSTTLDLVCSASGITNIQAIKIDIEGAELLALNGARRILEEFHPLVVCEADEKLQARFHYRQSDLLDLLIGLGYRISPLIGTWSPTIVACKR
jgi:FkbM family methyltransferase